DLGVDSIKRVEILSAIQERLPDAPAVKPEHLGTLHTLKDVADLLAGGAENAPARTKIPMLEVGADLVTKPITPHVEVEPATPDTEQLAGSPPPNVTDDAPAGSTRAGKGSSGVTSPAPRGPAATMPQPAGPFAGDRVDRSILQVVDLDLSAPRS